MLERPLPRILAVFIIVSTLLLGSRSLIQAKSGKTVVVATVKGKDIELTDLVDAAAPYRYQYEQQGVDFSTGSGKIAYQRLQEQVLQQLVSHELLRNAASNKGITVSDQDVNNEYKSVLKRAKMSEASLLGKLGKFGWNKERYLKDIKQQLIEEKFAAKYIAAGKTGDEFDQAVGDWLQGQAQNGVQIFFKVDTANQGDSLKSVEKAGMDYYSKKYGAKAAAGASAKATNYGCHTQIDISKDGKLVKSLGYSGGDIYEIN